MKPEYPKHPKVRKVSRDARLLNIHLWNLADDEGRLQELPQWIIGEVFPTDEDVTPVVLREWLGSLHDAGLITRYEVAGEAYIECHDFRAHQVINKPRESLIPAVPENYRSPTVGVREAYHPEQGTGNREVEQGIGANAPVELTLDDRARDLFAYWQQRCDHQQAKPTKDRIRKVVARLREGYTDEHVRCGIDGAAKAPYMSDDGRKFDDLELICRNGSKLESFIERGVKAAEAEDPEWLDKLNASRQVA